MHNDLVQYDCKYHNAEMTKEEQGSDFKLDKEYPYCTLMGLQWAANHEQLWKLTISK